MLFTNGLGAGTDIASWNVVINVVFCNERGCNLERASEVDIKESTEIDIVCIKQCHLHGIVFRGEEIQFRREYREKGDLGLASSQWFLKHP